MKCEDIGSSLAVIDSVEAAKQLSSNLRRGRPSMETAWIDATIKNSADERRPVWRKNKVDKNKLCLLLDQHIYDTHYVIAPCHRTRGYICYKKITEGQKLTSSRISIKHSYDIIFNNKNGYRLYYSQVDWFEAFEQCQKFKIKYEGKLVEPFSKQIIQEILYLMTKNITTFEHIWVGGRYVNDAWVWVSNNKRISIKYFHKWNPRLEIDQENKRLYSCLNLDKGHTEHPMVYGKVCSETQAFVCVFPKHKLLKLRKDEDKEDSETLNVKLRPEKNILVRYRSRRLNDKQISKCWKEYP
ncbi:hypothetical protein ILUMI_16225 [Ignelater luminosus]|uniref:C-type lectin domain-containing protein n=1 Tax=Ignelater luminosus TaxID=2038154 RepID=A0A8K0G958_IGNLU|nr:hypothetical protein ILUMI_16225 [Ignelater luminosus]